MPLPSRTLNCEFTLAHEMGHAIHSYLSNKNQPVCYSDYVIFVAEVASTCNESLLMQHLLKTTTDKKRRAYLINYFLEQFRTTLYRQTMFAEFELMINERMERGELSWEEACDEMRHIDNRPEVSNAQIEWVYREFLSRVDAKKLATIDRLRERGIRTYVLSNTNPTAIEIVRDRVREATGRELESYFDDIFLSYRLKILKPAPAIFEKMIALSGLNPKETLFIDDGSRNADTAHRLGFAVYCPPTNGAWRQIFEEVEN